MLKAIGFDLGGVIIYYSIPDQLQFLARELAVTPARIEAAFHHLRPLVDTGQIDNQEFWRRLIQESGSSVDPEDTKHLWSDDYVEGNPLISGMLLLVDRLKSNGYKVGLLSNIDPEHGEINRHRHIYEHFDAALLSNEIKARKPDPEAFLVLAEDLGVEPTEMAFIDDLPENVAGARAAGMIGIEFAGYQALLKEFDQLGIKFK